MASVEEIATLAMVLLKRSAVISINDTTEQARMANSCYPILRDALLEEYNWTFAVERKFLEPLAVRPVNQYRRAFQIPADCIRPLELRGNMAYSTPSGTETTTTSPALEYWDWNWSEPFVWVKEQDKILTNAHHLFLKYTYRVTQPGLFGSIFTLALAFKIAAFLAYPMTGKAALADSLEKKSFETAAKGQGIDAQIGTEEPFPQDDSWLRSRNASFLFNRGGWASGWRQGSI